ncbi:MAG TPA: hypothetical protein VG015_09615 [Candidatus Dormibacteraeota bacterium]|nr:hypothetical protein [Candidatus Dormibacteraeota bacterium]
MRSGHRWLGVAVFALPLAELGHLATYWLRFGSSAMSLQSQGAHAYFPAIAKLSLALVGAGILACAVALGLGRALLGRTSAWRSTPGLPLGPLLWVLLTIQVEIYLVQEVWEVNASGHLLTMPLLASALAWGLAGQAPVALIAALAVHWLSIHLDPIFARLRKCGRTAIWPGPVIQIALRDQYAWDGPAFETVVGILTRRGPPPSL